MTLSYSKYAKTDKTTQLLNDLMRINSDRINGYQRALDQSLNLDVTLRDEFKKIISESESYQQQLAERIREQNGEVNTAMTIMGKVYRAWMDLKIAFASSTQKSIITSCLYNEEIALHAYKAALAMTSAMEPEIRDLIERQAESLRRTHLQVKKYREMPQAMNYSLVYFN